MNIFALHYDPQISAEYHCDKHVVKMLIEYAQLLSTTHHHFDTPQSRQCYKKTHYNHPSAKWVRASYSNYRWLYYMWEYLHNEFMHRYGKGHKSFLDLADVLSHTPSAIADRGLMPVFLAMPDEFKRDCDVFDDSVSAYRDYYRHKLNTKIRMMTYKNRKVPEWLVS